MMISAANLEPQRMIAVDHRVMQSNGFEDSEGHGSVGEDWSGPHRSLDGWVGALDGLSPGLSAASSSESLKGMERGERRLSRNNSNEAINVEKKLSKSNSNEAIKNMERSERKTLPISLPRFPHEMKTRVQFQIHAYTQTGDHLSVVGSCPPLGCWQPDKAIPLHTDQSMYPMWTGSVEVPSGEPVEYKYIIYRRSTSEVEWEVDISNRTFTPEGVFVVLEDGKFNVERAQLLDRKQRKLAIDASGRTSVYNEYTEQQVSIIGECLYIISYKLPLRTIRGPKGSNDYFFEWHPGYATNTSSRHASYVVEKLRKLRKKAQIWYIGWLGIEVPPEDREKVSKILERDFQCLPVFLSCGMARDFQEFCERILRPTFHFMVPTMADMCLAFHKGALEKQSKWQTYNTVNLEMVQPLVERFNDGDYVWIVDIELLMVPAFVGARCKSANIGFVFNTPFPSSDIFRMLPARKEILRSVLNSNMIFFHCFTYARHFLTCCSRLLGLEYHSMRGGLVQLNFRGHHVHIRASHVGMDSGTFLEKFESDERVPQFKAKWNEIFRSKHVVLGYDDLEPMSGILLLLRAFQSLVRLFPSILGNVVLVLVTVPLQDAEGNEIHSDYRNEVAKLANELNNEYPGLVLHYHRRMPFAERVSLFSCADMLVNSSIRHGLNLVPFEFVLCGDEKKGGFVVSEFLGCSRVLPGAVRTNPWRDEDLARAIHKLLLQDDHEKKFWHELQVAFCKKNTVYSWAEKAFLDMKKIRETMLELGEDVRARCRVGIVKMPHKEMSSKHLKLEHVYSAYQQAQTRLLIVDIDLLLRPILYPEKALEGPATLTSKREIAKCLRNISEHQGNFLFLLSSYSPEEIRNYLGEIEGLDKVGLAAEDGYYYKWPGSPLGRWDTKMHITDEWKDVAVGLMRQYTQRTNGSWIEDDKISSVTWHWESANPEFGSLQGKELQNHLQEMLSHFPVRIVLGKTFVRVRHEGVTKGAFVEHTIKHYNNRGGVDFLLGIGDDIADEDMFKVIMAYHRDAQYRVVSNSQTVQEVKVFTCTVGRQPATASHCLYKAEEVLELMGGLFLVNKKWRSNSMLELTDVLGHRRYKNPW